MSMFDKIKQKANEAATSATQLGQQATRSISDMANNASKSNRLKAVKAPFLNTLVRFKRKLQ